jgi:hypothetical protein
VLVSVAASAVVSAIRALTDQDIGTKVTDLQLFAWIDREQQFLRRHIAEMSNLYDANFDVTLTGVSATIDMAAVVADFSKLKAVLFKLSGTRYAAIPHMAQEYGDNTNVAATAGDYRVKYTTRAGTVDDGADTLLLPAGATSIIEERVAAKVRNRFEEEVAFHLGEAQMLWERLRDEIISWHASTPMGVVEYGGFGYGLGEGSAVYSRSFRQRGSIIEIYSGYGF